MSPRNPDMKGVWAQGVVVVVVEASDEELSHTTVPAAALPGPGSVPIAPSTVVVVAMAGIVVEMFA
jgi:hypothetical protein